MKKKTYTSSDRKENTYLTLLNFLSIINLKINSDYLRKELNTHYSYPSLQSVSDTLSRIGVINKAFLINPQKHLKKITLPSIVWLKTEKLFAVIIKISDKDIIYSHSSKGIIKEKIDDFLSIWDGTILMYKEIKKHHWLQKRKKLQNNTIINIAYIISFLITFHLFINTDSCFLPAIQLLGSFIGIALLKIEYFADNSFYSKLCIIGEKFNCKLAASSKLSGILKIASLSEICFVFFTGNILILIIENLMNKELTDPFFFLIFALSIPFSIFSIFYQWIKIKKWCIYCLIMHTIIFLSFLWEAFHIQSNSWDNLSISTPIINLFFYFLIYTLWKKIKHINKQNKEIFLLKSLHNSFLGDSNIIETMLKTAQTLKINVSDNELILGNTKSQTTITFLLSPECDHCALAVQELLICYHNFPKNKYIIRFSNSSFISKKAKLAILNLYEIFFKEGESEFIQSLEFWYFGSNEKREKLIKTETASTETLNLFNNIKRWIEEYNLYSSPLIFINNKFMPSNLYFNFLFHYLKRNNEDAKKK